MAVDLVGKTIAIRGFLAQPAALAALLPGVQAVDGLDGTPLVRVSTDTEALALSLWYGEAGWTTSNGALRPPDDGAPGIPADLAAVVAGDVAAIVAEPTSANRPVNWSGLRMRAVSRQMAQARDIPAEVRSDFTADQVDLQVRSLPYARYFDAEDVTLRHPRHDGEMSEPILRTVLRAADAVTVLPYDPVTDRVLMVEQFRPGAFSRGDPRPWTLEPVAGRCDQDEPVEDVARREAMEEAGLTLTALENIGNYYPSPGTLSEYLYSYIGLCDLSGEGGGLHGLDSEHEDIRTHVLTFEDAFSLTRSGEAENGPLLLSLMYLALHRSRLRDTAGAG